MSIKRNSNIDILRVLAACMVLMVHVTEYAGYSWFGVGSYGVQLFFIISGYLAFLSLDGNDDVRMYYKKRILRICPTYYICLMLMLFKDYLVHFTGIFQLKFFRYVFFIHCLIPSDNWDLWNNHGALWTMSSFMLFYILAPWLFKIFKHFYVGLALVVIILFANYPITIWIESMLNYYPEDAHISWFAQLNPLTSMYCFLLGAMLFIAVKEGRQFMYCFLMTISLLIWPGQSFVYEVAFLLMMLSAVCFDNWIQNDRIAAGIKSFGAASFTLYLLHPTICDLVEYAWMKAEIGESAVGPIFFVTLLVMSVFVSFLLYKFVISRVERLMTRMFLEK